MSDLAILFLLYGVGLLMLVAEIFIPSHAVLTMAGVGFLAAAVVKTFLFAGREAGILAIFGCMIVFPTFAVVAVKYWRRTPIGRRIVPPNPVLTPKDTSVPVEELTRLLGQTGRAVTPLRPVGICVFNGRRVSCVAEFGLIESGVAVHAVRVAGSNLAVEIVEEQKSSRV